MTTVFDTTDRVQHMFYRYLDPTHPANAGKDTTEWAGRHRAGLRADGRAARPGLARGRAARHRLHGDQRPRLHELPPRREPQHLAARQRATSSSRTAARRAATGSSTSTGRRRGRSRLGLTGLFVNRKGREKTGIVAEGDEYRTLVAEIAAKLEALVDPETGERAIRKVRATYQTFDGPYRFDAPDLLVGYEGGYRNSWECATGSVTAERLHATTRSSWSGDHCVDPDIVPGVFFCNRRIRAERPAPRSTSRSACSSSSARSARGHMQGEMIFGREAAVGGPLDAGAARASRARRPGARVVASEGRRVRARAALALLRAAPPGRLRRAARGNRTVPACSCSASTAWIR